MNPIRNHRRLLALAPLVSLLLPATAAHAASVSVHVTPAFVDVRTPSVHVHVDKLRQIGRTADEEPRETDHARSPETHTSEPAPATPQAVPSGAGSPDEPVSAPSGQPDGGAAGAGGSGGPGRDNRVVMCHYEPTEGVQERFVQPYLVSHRITVDGDWLPLVEFAFDCTASRPIAETL